jgi:hypothetical protein
MYSWVKVFRHFGQLIVTILVSDQEKIPQNSRAAWVSWRVLELDHWSQSRVAHLQFLGVHTTHTGHHTGCLVTPRDRATAHYYFILRNLLNFLPKFLRGVLGVCKVKVIVIS